MLTFCITVPFCSLSKSTQLLTDSGFDISYYTNKDVDYLNEEDIYIRCKRHEFKDAKKLLEQNQVEIIETAII